MVKADVKIDYYAALGLGPNAEVEEIKKQFRKLALKWHPDRNPGKENEVNSKFQAIQAAHEILTDPQQRLKYDTDRLRAGYGRVSGPPKSRPQAGYPHYPTSSTQNKPFYSYDQRGRPTPSGTYAPPPPPPPSAGAKKYAGYAKAGAAKWDKQHDDARTRADAFRGFQDMKNSRHNPSGWAHFDPHTGEPANYGGRGEGAAGTRPHTQRPQSAYEAFFGKQPPSSQERAQKGQKSKKRDGFTPWTPGGDEPMAKNTSAYVHNSSKSERFEWCFEAAPSPTARKNSEPGPTPPNLERTSSRYAGASGEKTHISGHASSHSKNARNSSPARGDPRSHTNPASPTSPRPTHQTRHRSASPKLKPHRKEPLVSPSATSSSDSDEVLPNFRPKAVPRSRKFAAGPKCTRLPNFNNYDYGVAFGSDSWLHDEPAGLRRTGKPGNASENWDRNANDQSSGSDNRASQTSQNLFAARGKLFDHGNVHSKTSTDSIYEGGQWSDGGVKTKISPPSNGVAPEGKSSHSQDSPKKPSNSGLRGESHTSQQHRKTRVERGRSGQWQSGSYSAETPADRTAQKTTTPHDLHTHQPASSGQFGEHVPKSDDNKSTEAKPNFAETQFCPDQWQDILNTNTWSMPPPGISRQQQHQTEPRRQKSPKKQPKAVPKRTAVPQHATVSTEAEEAEAAVGAESPADSKQKSSSGEERMDVDEDTAHTKPQNMPKDSEKATAKGQAKADSKAESASKPSFLDLKNLESVSPFTATSGDGINNLQDLSSTLPFDSKPGNNPQASTNIRPRDLALPKPPKTPSAPTLVTIAPHPGAAPELVLPRTAWDRYIAEMGRYMVEWSGFNNKMLGHFSARQAIVETGLSPNWMKAVGDSGQLNLNDGNGPNDEEQLVLGQAKGGFSAYLRGVEEDFVVREHWSVAWERHRECILVLGRVREWIRRGGKIHQS